MGIFHAARPRLANVWKSYLRNIYGDPGARTIFAPDYLHLLSIRRFIRQKLTSLEKGQIMLDVGCGDQRYRRFVPQGVKYVGLDYEPTRTRYYSKTPLPDIIGSAEMIPSESARYDFILCTEVLEHVQDIAGAFDEMARVLKPGGSLLMTVPFLFPEHDPPYDFRRFTLFGIKYECERAGLQIVENEKLGGAGTVMSGIFFRFLHSLAKSSKLGTILFYFPGMIVFPVIHLIGNVLGYLLDLLPSSEFYIGVGLLSRKDE